MDSNETRDEVHDFETEFKVKGVFLGGYSEAGKEFFGKVLWIVDEMQGRKVKNFGSTSSSILLLSISEMKISMLGIVLQAEKIDSLIKKSREVKTYSTNFGQCLFHLICSRFPLSVDAVGVFEGSNIRHSVIFLFLVVLAVVCSQEKVKTRSDKLRHRH